MKTYLTQPSSTVSKQSIQQLRLCERRWLKAREHLIALEAQKIFWFGSQSAIAWIIAPMVSYAIITLIFMIVNKILGLSYSAWAYVWLFIVQAIIFAFFFVCRGLLNRHLESRIKRCNNIREQALADMYLVATIDILKDIHTHTPMSLRGITSRYNNQIQMVSLQRILQKEIEESRMSLIVYGHEVHLPPEFAEAQLNAAADRMIYRSLIKPSSFSHSLPNDQPNY